MLTDKNNILFFANGFPSEASPYKCVFNLHAVRKLSEHVNVTVVIIKSWKPFNCQAEKYEYAGIPVLVLNLPLYPFASDRLPFSDSRLIFWMSLVVSLLSVRKNLFRTGKYSLVHSVSYGIPSYIAGYFARTLGIPHIMQIIGTDVNVILPLLNSLPDLMHIDLRIDGVIANSWQLADLYRNYHADTPIRVIYRGVDLARFDPGEKQKNRTVPASTTFLYLGGFPYSSTGLTANVKGGETIKLAWRTYEEELSKTKAKLVIGGPACDIESVNDWLKTLAHPELIEIIGPVHPDRVPDLMRSVDVVLIPSLSEGLPNVGMEALASGRAIIGSRVGGIPEIVRDRQEGYLVPPGDADAWGKAVLLACSEKENIIDFGINARRRAEAEFDSSSYGRNVHDFYQEILNHGVTADSGEA